MKVWKIIKWVLLGCLLLPVTLILLIVLALIILINWKYEPHLNQPVEQIAKIELLDTHKSPNTLHHNEEILYTLGDSEIEIFMEKFEDLKFYRHLSPPSPWCYGLIAVRITYQDGWYDTVGLHINTYQTQEGEGMSAGGWFYVCDKEAFIALFCEYVDPSQIPTEMATREEVISESTAPTAAESAATESTAMN